MLQKLKDKMSEQLYGMTAKEAQARGICVQCRQNALANCYSDAGVKEFYISGMCEKCFDNLCMEIE